MKLQKNTRFALTSVLEAAAQPGRAVSAGAIARKHGISAHHLAKVLHTLARAGVLASTRGVGGGYRFVGNARRLTLMDVIELFEAIAAPAPRPARGAAAERAIGTVLAEIDAMAEATLRSITIATLLKIAARAVSPSAASPRAARA